MKTVLYTNDMEPITIIYLSSSEEKYLKKYSMVHIDIPSPLMYAARNYISTALVNDERNCFRKVTIFAEQFMHNDEFHTMLFTHKEEDALRLKCAFLLGQYAGIQELDQQRFADGVLFAVSEAMRKGDLND